MTFQSPPPLVNELVMECLDRNNFVALHRVWIARDGTITLPDHTNGYDHENVISALGGQPDTPCSHWSITRKTRNNPENREALNFPPPNIMSWTYTHEQQWTQRSMWTANSALLGQLEFRNLPPVTALTNAQALLNAAAISNETLADALFLLANPWERDQGWRRTKPVPTATVLAYLNAGVSPELVPDVAALDVPPSIARTLIAQFSQYGLPQTALVAAASILPVADLAALGTQLTSDVARNLPLRLHRLAKEPPERVTREQIEDLTRD